MYDHVARKFIISHNVQFVENEAWDGTIEKIVTIEHDDIEDEVVQTSCKVTTQSLLHMALRHKLSCKII